MLTFLVPLPTMEMEMFLNIPSDIEDDFVFSPGFDDTSSFGFSFSLFFRFSCVDDSSLTLLFCFSLELSSSSSVMVSFKLMLMPVDGTSLEAAFPLSSFRAVVG